MRTIRRLLYRDIVSSVLFVATAFLSLFRGVLVVAHRTAPITRATVIEILAIAIASVSGRSENSIILVLGLLGILPMARIVRASFLSLREMEYVDAARALGLKNMRIMFRHIMPNALQPVIIYATISIGGVILAEAALSFLGVGPQDPTPAWGLMVSQGKGDLANAPHLVFFPGLAISSTVLAFVLIGDGLRDALDPKLR